MFQGSIVAIVTPFKDGMVDEPKLRELIEFHASNGTDGIVPCGTTGESPTLSHEEHERVVEVTVQAVRGRMSVIAGTGSNSTSEAIRLTKHAEKAGADGALLVVPYYNKPNQKGLYEHYAKIAESVSIPLIVYNIPGRTGVDLLPETLAKLAEDHKNIAGLKEATGNLRRASEVVSLCPENFVVLSGDDNITLPIMSVGGKGVISVVANIAPADVAAMCHAFLKGDLETAKKYHYKTFPLAIDLFIETNPIPVKTAMALMGMLNGDMRLPLSSMSESNLNKLKSTLKNYGLI
jgi:4-hydroxy-tetrahydrodipicolinate synthase